jgi:hypothetical protein
VRVFYADNGWTLKAVPAATKEEATQMAAREFGSAATTVRVYRDSDRLPVIFHDRDHKVVEETTADIYALLVTSIDQQGWGPDDPGLGLITADGEQLSVVFGHRSHAQEIADDLRENLTVDYHLW